MTTLQRETVRNDPEAVLTVYMSSNGCWLLSSGLTSLSGWHHSKEKHIDDCWKIIAGNTNKKSSGGGVMGGRVDGGSLKHWPSMKNILSAKHEHVGGWLSNTVEPGVWVQIQVWEYVAVSFLCFTTSTFHIYIYIYINTLTFVLFIICSKTHMFSS